MFAATVTIAPNSSFEAQRRRVTSRPPSVALVRSGADDGADDGNRTRVFSLGSRFGVSVAHEAGAALSPHALTSRWARMLKAAGVRHIRFHDARHTCGTLMHLQDVPIAVILAWLGHSSKAFTMATYVHAQRDALSTAAQSFARVVTNRDNSV